MPNLSDATKAQRVRSAFARVVANCINERQHEEADAISKAARLIEEASPRRGVVGNDEFFSRLFDEITKERAV